MLKLIPSISLIFIFLSCSTDTTQDIEKSSCSADWYEHIALSVITGDTQGHGPDTGSEEWKSVVEFKLGIRGNPENPDYSNPEWCAFVQSLIDQL